MAYYIRNRNTGTVNAQGGGLRSSRIGREELLAALALPGVSQRQLAQALGVADARVSDWKTGKVAQPNVTHEELARAVATVTGAAPARALDVRSYTAGLLVGLEGDAVRIIDRIHEARQALGLAASPVAVGRGRHLTPADAGTRAREAVGAVEAARGGAARRRRKGR